MSELKRAFEAYIDRFGDDPPLYQLRFYGDEDIIEMLNKATDNGIQITAEDLESRLPDNATY